LIAFSGLQLLSVGVDESHAIQAASTGPAPPFIEIPTGLFGPT
jgi:hypothetical protein